MKIELKPIGIVHCELNDSETAPKYFSVSDVEGVIEVFPEFAEGLYRIEERDYLTVVFYFHEAEDGHKMKQVPHSGGGEKGIFATCSPKRPNHIGVSVVKLLKVEKNKLFVKNLDMLDGTPVLDIKPYKPM